MTETTTDDLRDRAAQLRAEAAEAEAAIRAADAAERARIAAAREARDREFVASWNPAPLDAAVDKAHAALDALLEADPLVQALVAFQLAQARRRWLKLELVACQGRLGTDVSNAPVQDPPTPVALDAYLSVLVERLAADALRAETAEFNSREDH